MAETFAAAGHEVVIIDLVTRAFDRLPHTFRGTAIRGDGTDEDTLRRAGVEGADLFLALTEGDNRNVMATQLAHDALHVERVVAKINDPVRAQAYAELGIATICRTILMADAISAFLGLPVSGKPGIFASHAHAHADGRPSETGQHHSGSSPTRTRRWRSASPSLGRPTPGRPEPCSCSSSVGGRSGTT